MDLELDPEQELMNFFESAINKLTKESITASVSTDGDKLIAEVTRTIFSDGDMEKQTIRREFKAEDYVIASDEWLHGCSQALKRARFKLNKLARKYSKE